jgi:exosortase
VEVWLYLPAIAAASWAVLTEAPDWLLVSLIAYALAFAAAAKGVSGVRLLAVPVLALSLAIPLPGPLENEVLWLLQRFAASGTVWVHGLFGLGTTGEGVTLQRAETTFLVIEECSGLRTLLMLTLVSLVIRELFREGGVRMWLVVILSVPIACVANLLRVAWVAASDVTALSGGHASQGILTLSGGTLAAFALARLLCRPERGSAESKASAAPLRWRTACIAMLVTTVLVYQLPGWPASPAEERLDRFEGRGGWVGEELSPDWLFFGSLPLTSVVQRRFERTHEDMGLEVVELFVGLDNLREPRSSPFSSKLVVPARDWSVESHQRQKDWRLFREIDVVVAKRGHERVLVRVWRPGSEELWAETLRSLFALERGPFARERARTVVRIATPLRGDTAGAHREAQRTLDRFVVNFREPLDALEGDG